LNSKLLLSGALTIGLLLTAFPAHSEPRWPANVCQDLQDYVRDYSAKHFELYGQKGFEKSDIRAILAHHRVGLLFLQKHYCGVDISKTVARDQRATARPEKQPAAQAVAVPAPMVPMDIYGDINIHLDDPAATTSRKPMNCVTTKVDQDLATTTCD
jgi:hypothetical protein